MRACNKRKEKLLQLAPGTDGGARKWQVSRR